MTHTCLLKAMKRLIIHYMPLLCFAQCALALHLHAQSNIVTNQIYLNFNGSGNQGYLIASTQPDGSSDSDHMHLIATFSCNWVASCITTYDITFGNRGGFYASYSARGVYPLNQDVHIAAYRQSDSSTNIYLILGNYWDSATYSVLENINDTAYPSPSSIGSQTPPGTLVFDTAVDQPNTFSDNSGTLWSQGHILDMADDDPGTGFVSGTSTPYGISFGWGSGEGISSARTSGSPNQDGLDFYTSFQKRVSITQQGSLGIGTSSPSATLEVNGNAKVDGPVAVSSIQFADGSSQTTASAITQVNGVTQAGLTLAVSGNTNPNTPGQGAYLNWNALTGGTGETDFINNEGLGSGGFAFFNTPASGSPRNLLMFLNGAGNLGVGTPSPQETLHVVSPDVSLSTSGSSFGNANVTIQGNDPTRTIGRGAALSFAVPATTDGNNPWEQGRVLVTPDSASNNDASGRMYIQARYLNGNTWDWRNNLVLSSAGYVGVGTTSPSATLEVNGNVKLTAGTGASVTFPDGTVQSTAWNGTTFGGDYAESVDVLGERSAYEPGDVIVIDADQNGRFGKSTTAYSRMVAGVYSTKPGLVGRRTTINRTDKVAEVPMAMMGIVPTKVTTENGPIERGDLLVSSSTPGRAMKGTDRDLLMGSVIGKALAPLKSGSGIIEVLISLQ